MAAARRESSVEMIRILPRKGEGEEEELFDVEKELGRDVKSVFKMLDDGGKEKSTNTKFVTAEELERLRKERGGKEEDAETEPVKPLWQILQEQRDVKEEKFQEGWKTMKEGKNRPLEEDEIEFLDEVEEQKRENEKRKREEEKELSKQFKLAKARSHALNSKTAAAAEESEEKKKRESGGRDDGVGVDDDGDGDFAAKKAKKAKNTNNAKKKLLKVAKKKTTIPQPVRAEKEVENNNNSKSSLGLLGGYSSSSE
ncbi:unnamed protein product [Bathycoccus prasinos]